MQEIEDLIEEKFEETQRQVIEPELRPLRLELNVEQSDIRIKKYFEIVEESDKKIRTMQKMFQKGRENFDWLRYR